MPVVAVVNTKGGVGKTTTAMLLAAQAAASGHDACVLDGDPQATATKWVYAVEEAGEVLPFTVQVANAGSIAHLSTVGERWVFIDTPPGSSSTIDAAINRADFTIIPTAAATADMWQTMPTISVLQGRPFAVLLTMARANTVLVREVRQLLTEQAVSSFDAVVPLREVVKNLVGAADLTSPDTGYAQVFAELDAALAPATSPKE